jgi:hypothetical protein
MIDWKNWKTGAKIGFFYGLICAIFFLPGLIAQNFPLVLPNEPPNTISMCGESCHFIYEFMGIILFFPIFLITSLITNPFYQSISGYNLILMYSIIEIIVGTALGAIVGYLFGRFKK